MTDNPEPESWVTRNYELLPCPICRQNCRGKKYPERQISTYFCKNCGSYDITDEAAIMLGTGYDYRVNSLLQTTIYNTTNKTPVIDRKEVEDSRRVCWKS